MKISYPSASKNIEYAGSFLHRFSSDGSFHRITAIFQFTGDRYSINIIGTTRIATTFRKIFEWKIFWRLEAGFVFLDDEESVL